MGVFKLEKLKSARVSDLNYRKARRCRVGLPANIKLTLHSGGL